jgi:hypothetical protein
MSIHHQNEWHSKSEHIVDYETLWILIFSATVLSSGILALFSMSQDAALP